MLHVANRLLTFLFCTTITLFINTSLSAQTDSSKANKRFRDFKTEHMWDAKVRIGSLLMLGESKLGVRRIIPILGGTFEGAGIKGEVLPVGADWQTVRTDGDTELNARYLLKTNDGYMIQVINKVLMHTPPKGTNTGMYIKSVVDLEAPVSSPYSHLNHAIFLGTLEVPSFKPGEDPYVIIGVYKVL